MFYCVNLPETTDEEEYVGTEGLPLQHSESTPTCSFSAKLLILYFFFVDFRCLINL